MEAGKKKGTEWMTKRKKEGHRQTEPGRRQAEPRQRPSLRETERLKELEVPPGRGRHGTAEARVCQSWPHSVLRAGENPLIMQMALGVAIEGHLFCIPWAAAGGLGFRDKPSSSSSCRLSQDHCLPPPPPPPVLSPQSPVLLPGSLRRARGEAEKGCVLRGERRERREEGLSSRKRSQGGSFWGSEAAERERKGEASNKPICQERPGPHHPNMPPLWRGELCVQKAEPRPCVAWAQAGAERTPELTQSACPAVGAHMPIFSSSI